MVLYLALRGLQVGVEIRRRPELAGKPLAIAAGDRLIDWTAAAGELREDWRRSRWGERSDLIRLPAGDYREASQRFYELLARFTPMLEPTGENAGYLEGSLADLVGLWPLLVPELGWGVEVGAGPGRALAQAAFGAGEAGRLPPAPLPVGVYYQGEVSLTDWEGLRSSERLELERFGLTTPELVATAGEETLGRLLGRRGRILWSQAAGLDRPRDYPWRRLWNRYREFPGGLTEWSALYGVLDQLASELAADLVPRAEGVSVLSLSLEEEGGKQVGRRRFSRPEGRKDSLRAALRALLKGLSPSGAVLGLEVWAEGLFSRPTQTLDLWGWTRPEAGRVLDELGRRFSSRQISLGARSPSRRERLLAFWDPWR